MKTHKSKNLLEIIPVHADTYNWIENDNGIIQIQIDRNSWLDKLVRVFLKTPKQMKIDLDLFGSKVWLEIDGEKNIKAIGNILKKTFGESVEPLYPRLGKYISILKNNKFIYFK